MSTVLRERAFPQARARRAAWLMVALSLAVLYTPTYVAFAHGIWRDDAYAHGPIILAIVAWLVWHDREALLAPSEPAPILGTPLFVLGLALEIVGRSQSLALFEGASHLPLIAGLLLILRGPAAVRRLAFPLLFLLFLVPLPGFVLDTATAPLKAFVSASVEGLLRVMGQDVERSGVVLAIGGHQMLVADACSGLNSIYSLFAMGLLYAHLTKPAGAARMASLLIAVLPIAIVANILRVLALVLVTLYFGDEAGQGILHGLAGLLVFAAAFALLVSFDRLIWGRTPFSGKRGYVPHFQEKGVRPRFSVAIAVATAMVASAAAAAALKPAPANAPIDLESAIPVQFGEWRIDPDVVPVTPAPDVQANLQRLYQQVVSRTYVDANGARVMLTIAHGGDQSDALKAHRQEVCYAAQGFTIHGLEHGDAAIAGRVLPVTRFVGVERERVEPVTYWFTMGDRVVLGRWDRLRVQLGSGLAGKIPDGMLVRVSSLSGDAPRAFAAQQAFLAALFAAVPAADATRFVGRQD